MLAHPHRTITLRVSLIENRYILSPTMRVHLTPATYGASPFGERPDIAHESASHSRTSEAARLLAACAASENVDGHPALVKQFVMRAQKTFQI